uniref:Uncharacterized protein n=1 Tax=Glossina pallidipes TaxID=7398 RepID=A0A1A9ZPM7_GLOPL
MDKTYLVAVAFFGATFGYFSVETSCFSASLLGSRIFEEIDSLSGWMLVHGRGCARLQGVMSLTMPVNLLLQITGLPAWTSKLAELLLWVFVNQYLHSSPNDKDIQDK